LQILIRIRIPKSAFKRDSQPRGSPENFVRLVYYTRVSPTTREVSFAA